MALLAASVLAVASPALLACPPDSSPQPKGRLHLSRNEALQRAKVAAREHGFELSNYVLDTFGGSGKLNGEEWLFSFVCKPPESRPPGCEFLVVVNRGTGETKVMPGM